MADIVQYIIANQGLGMSSGKLAAQVAHAAVKSYLITCDREALEFDTSNDKLRSVIWNSTGYAKIVLAARDTEHLLTIERYLTQHGIDTYLIIDEGRTEIAPHTPTALGVELVDKDDPEVKFLFSALKLYKDKPVANVPKSRRLTKPSWMP